METQSGSSGLCFPHMKVNIVSIFGMISISCSVCIANIGSYTWPIFLIDCEVFFMNL